MVIKAHAGGLGEASEPDRDQQFELQGLLESGSARPSSPPRPKNAVAGQLYVAGDSQQVSYGPPSFDPSMSELEDLLRRTDPNELAHAERLQPVDVGRWLAPETIGGNIEDQAVAGDRTAGGHHRIDRIASRRAQHEVGGAQRVGPILAAFRSLDCLADVPFVPAQTTDDAEEVGKALQIALPFDMATVHDRGKSQHLRARGAMAGDQAAQCSHDPLIQAGPRIQAVDAGHVEQAAEDRLQPLTAGRRFSVFDHCSVP